MTIDVSQTRLIYQTKLLGQDALEGFKFGAVVAILSSTAYMIVDLSSSMMNMTANPLNSILLKGAVVTGLGFASYNLVKTKEKIQELELTAFKDRDHGMLIGGAILMVVTPTTIGSNCGIYGKVCLAMEGLVFGSTLGSTIGGYLGRYFD